MGRSYTFQRDNYFNILSYSHFSSFEKNSIFWYESGKYVIFLHESRLIDRSWRRYGQKLDGVDKSWRRCGQWRRVEKLHRKIFDYKPSLNLYKEYKKVATSAEKKNFLEHTCKEIRYSISLYLYSTTRWFYIVS